MVISEDISDFSKSNRDKFGLWKDVGMDKFKRTHTSRAAFTLIELSIVLVVIGLLLGGILYGRFLIRAAQLKSVSTDITKFNTGINAFRSKYFMLPGDLNNAQAFWPGGTGCGPTDTNGQGVCNGNGNGVLNPASIPGGNTPGAGAVPSEIFQMWLHLERAGLISGGNYTGRNNPVGWRVGSARAAVPGLNVPRGAVPNTGYSIEHWGTVTSSSPSAGITWEGNYGHSYIFGMHNPPTESCCPPELTILRPDEAWSIDVKLDDGRPGLGFITTFYRRSYTLTQTGNRMHCTTTNDRQTAEYNGLEEAFSCQLMVKTGL